jgi:hypothetical protein
VTANALPRISRPGLHDACGNAELAAKLDDVCSAFSNVRTVRALALWAGVASVLFPLLVMLASAVCKANRNLLLRIFAPGLYICNLVVSVLVIVQGVVLMGTIYYGEPALLGRIHYGLHSPVRICRACRRILHHQGNVRTGKESKDHSRRAFAQGWRIPSTVAVREWFSEDNPDRPAFRARLH